MAVRCSAWLFLLAAPVLLMALLWPECRSRKARCSLAYRVSADNDLLTLHHAVGGTPCSQPSQMLQSRLASWHPVPSMRAASWMPWASGCVGNCKHLFCCRCQGHTVTLVASISLAPGIAHARCRQQQVMGQLMCRVVLASNGACIGAQKYCRCCAGSSSPRCARCRCVKMHCRQIGRHPLQETE